jgi:hypothetical protein
LAKFKEAAEPGFKCFKGSYDLLKAAAVECNLSSGPGFDPFSCFQTIAGIPDLIEDCRTAYALVAEAIDLVQQSRAFYGAAEVAFSDQGGDEIAVQLAACGETTCAEIAAALSDAARRAKERAERDIEILRRHQQTLQDVEAELQRCEVDDTQCREIPEHPVPQLDDTVISRPDIVLG